MRRGPRKPGPFATERSPRSVRGKLLRVVMLTTLVALLITGIAMLTNDLTAYRLSWARDLTTEADILTLATAPALAFDDKEVARQDLAALRVRPGLRVAALYDVNGKLYAQYVASGEQLPPPSIAPQRLRTLSGAARVAGERVEVFRPVEQRGEWLGTVYLMARYSLVGRIRAYLTIFALVTLGSLILALVLSERLQAAITSPLAAMAAVARQVIQKRDYSLRAEKTTDDEIGIVVEAFNGMLDEVQARTQALRDADRRKDEFLATLAHELRNPLAPIRHATKILESPRADERQRRWAEQVIARQVQRMALLLDDLLDVSRITRGRLELRKEPVELATVVHSAVEVARPLIDAKQHTLEIHLPREPTRFEADPLRLSQALSNLLTNAAKYTDPHGRILIRAERQRDELRIEIDDTGIGLSPEALSQLFQPFTQLNATISRSEGGLGIGLALVKGLIELHGGTVEASSPGVGRGARFTVRMPAAAVAEKRPAADQPEAAAARPAGRLNVLLVDDNCDAANTLAVVLRMAGHEVCVAHNGADALQIAAREHPQVYVLDIGMPGMTGYELAGRIRAESWGKRALLLALTGWGQLADRQRALSAGFDQHLTKPVSPDELQRLIAGVAERSAGSKAPGGEVA